MPRTPISGASVEDAALTDGGGGAVDASLLPPG